VVRDTQPSVLRRLPMAQGLTARSCSAASRELVWIAVASPYAELRRVSTLWR